MGVHSLSGILLGSTARPVQLESLEEKRMAIDASIWIYQFLKAMRDPEGNPIKNSHITGFFRRICKLLYFGIKPVFIFDGGVPALKANTIKQRNERRQGKRDNAKQTARKLLALQLYKDTHNVGEHKVVSDDQKRSGDQIVFRPQDDWDLPTIEGFHVDRDDERVNLNYEEEKEKHKLMSSIVDETIDELDLDSINPQSEEFEELPKALQYQILTKLRLRSRLRMGYTKEQLEAIFPNSLDFSKFQIDMVKRRNFFTQKLINITGMHDGGASKLTDEYRISSKKDKNYKLTKTESGWTLGLDEQAGSEASKPIVLDKESLSSPPPSQNVNSSDVDNDNDGESDFEWEEVELKPTGKRKDSFDYSLKAGRLPQLESVDKNAGGQSFLDKRSEWDLVGTDLPSKTIYVSVDDSPIKPKERIIFVDGNSKTDKDDKGTPAPENNKNNSNKPKLYAEDETEDEYEQQLKEIEMMENFQMKRLAQIQEANMKKEELKKHVVANEQKKINENAKQMQQSENRFTPVLTEGEQNLRFIMGKIPKLDTNGPGSFLFAESNDPVIHVETEVDDSKVSKEQKSTPLPSWFEETVATEKSIDHGNPFSSTSFVQDRGEPTVKDTNKAYELSSGLNAQHLIESYNKNLNQHAPYYRGFQGDGYIVNSDDNSNNNITVVVDNAAETTQVNLGQENEEEEKEKETLTRPETEDLGSQSGEVGKHVSLSNEDLIRESTTTTTQNEPATFNYEFSEDEEDAVVENIRQEQIDFNKFTSNVLLRNPEDASKNLAETAFLEDELYRQQARDKRDSDEVTSDMIRDIQELLAHFGIPFITAPMEAEAQCAELLKLGLVDGIITDDSDVFLFGGTKVYKNLFRDNKYVEFYESSKILRDLGLDRHNMIELAFLLGSDYTTGVKGMGPVSSMEVIASFENLEAFKNWYNEGQFDREKLKTESSGQKALRRRLVHNEVIFDSNFPNSLVYEAYLNPEVDHDTTPFSWGYPDLDMLRRFLRHRLLWPQEKSDEVLVPLIRSINSKKNSKRQRKLTEFFPTEVLY